MLATPVMSLKASVIDLKIYTRRVYVCVTEYERLCADYFGFEEANKEYSR